jgi:hypothetical protein
LVRPDTVLRWHRDLLACRHAAASRPRRRGRSRELNHGTLGTDLRRELLNRTLIWKPTPRAA